MTLKINTNTGTINSTDVHATTLEKASSSSGYSKFSLKEVINFAFQSYNKSSEKEP